MHILLFLIAQSVKAGLEKGREAGYLSESEVRLITILMFIKYINDLLFSASAKLWSVFFSSLTELWEAGHVQGVPSFDWSLSRSGGL